MADKSSKHGKKDYQEDVLVDSYAKFMEFWKKNQTKILGVAGALAAVIILIGVYVESQKAANQEASAELAQVIPVYQTGSYQDAIDGRTSEFLGLTQIVNEYGSTESGQAAKIYLANCYYNLGEFDKAYEAFDSFSGSNKLFSAAAVAGKAACLLENEKFEEAAGLYKEAAKVDDNNPLNSEYLVKSGMNYEKVGQDAKAKEIYKNVIEEYTGTPAVDEAQRRVASL